MNKDILNTNIQSFIQKNLAKDTTKLILKGSPFPNVRIQELVEQILSKNKCKNKLPTWFNTKNIYYPNKINIEQSSSEITARYKSGLIDGNSLIDITGGYGVDSYYFSKKIKKVTYCDLNSDLSEIVSHNNNVLKTKNITAYPVDGLKYLKQHDHKFDWIYVDPSRRNESKGKVFLLEDCLPNVPEQLDLLFKYSNNILLKLSPVLDIKATIQDLSFVKEIHIIALKNEVKELLFILQNGFKNEIKIKSVNIKKESNEFFESVYHTSTLASFSLPKTYLYEPNASILKAGLFNEVSDQLNIDKLHINSHLYTNDDLIYFPGRRFKITHVLSYNKKELKKLIPSQKANITTRNFPETVKQIRKKIGFKDGGNNFLFFTTNMDNKHIVLVCDKV